MKIGYRGWAWAALFCLGFVSSRAKALESRSELNKMLGFKPTQSGVDYDIPTGKAEIEACRVEKINDPKGNVGYILRDGQGRILRKFSDTNGKRGADGHPHLDQWSYFKDGFEVYRENDLNEDNLIDECRWLNAGGTRIAEIKESKIVAWKRLSAEEAAKVLTQALATHDSALVNTVLVQAEELSELGLPKGLIAQTRAAQTDREKKLKELFQRLVATGWSAETTLINFEGKLPHAIPSDPALGLKDDILLYENAMIFAGAPDGKDTAKIAYLNTSDLIRIGDVWKFLDLPAATDPEKPSPMAARDGVRAWVFRAEQAGHAPANDPAFDEAVAAVARHDEAGAPDPNDDPDGFIRFQLKRNQLLGKVVDRAKNAADKLAYEKQRIDCVVAMYQTGKYPEGRDNLEKLIALGGKLGSYAAFRKLSADNAIESEKPGVNLLKVQEAFIRKIEDFLKRYKESDETPDALFQLAVVREFNNEESEARDAYGRLAREFGSTETGKKAAGALRRLDLVGKKIELAGEGPNGPVEISKLRGKSVLIVFWSAAIDSGRHDLKELIKLREKHSGQLEIVSVNLDNDLEQRDRYLKSTPLPWPQIHEPKGTDGKLADEFGIFSLPTMILVGPDGKVLNRNLRAPLEVEKLLDSPAKVASDRKE